VNRVDLGEAAIDATVLRDLLDGRWAQTRQAARERLGELSLPDPDLGTEDHRTRVLEQLRKLGSSGHALAGFPVAYGGDGDIGAAITSFEMLGFRDLSLR
jgi:acyl-CoA oxidase